MRSEGVCDELPQRGLETEPDGAEEPLGACAGHALPLRDTERMGALLARLEPRLTAVALRITKDPETARDVVQNAFEKVIRHGEQFAGNARVSTWMHRIVANEALMWLRAQRRREALSAEVEVEAFADPLDGARGPCPVESLVRRERVAHLRDGITRLSAHERDVVIQCSLAGESYAAYGARTGHHPAAIKSRAFRARRRLRDLLRGAPAVQPGA